MWYVEVDLCVGDGAYVQAWIWACKTPDTYL
jgi:hypothetical protein